MIIVRLQGGMGNQMFQYALGRVLAIKNNVPLGLDLTFLLDRTPMPSYFTFRDYNLGDFNIEATIVSKKDIPFLYRKYNFGIFMRYIDFIRRRLLSTEGKEKKGYVFDSAILELGPNAYLEGWWQNPTYFENIKDVIRKDFTLKNLPSNNIQILANEISKTNSLCIHVRRGDYVGNKNHEIVDKEYYTKGIEYISKIIRIEKIYVFSDDIEWCKNNFSFDFQTMFVGGEYVGKKDEGHIYLMSLCKNFIITNSSFSWWAAWLGTNPKKIVIAPKQWLPDITVDTNGLIPDNWIKI